MANSWRWTAGRASSASSRNAGLAAVACADAGADVTIAYRGDAFHRAKLKNQQTLQVAIDKGLVKAEMGATPTAVTEDLVTLKRGGESFDLPNDDMLVFIGTKLPSGFLKKLGIRMEGEMDWLRIVWISGFALLTYLLYVLKQKKDFFPFGEGDPFSGVPAALNVDLGFRTVEAGFWGTVLYSVVILVFGIRAYRKYPMKLHKNRYLQLIGFQLVFLFGIPELIAPFIIERPWRMYGISVPWPLWTGSLVDGPGWGTETSVALGWMAAGAIVAFVVVPLYVRRNGLRFCSYLCGCGGLAETLGDYWRHLAPRGKTAQQMEIFGKLILLAAVPVTLMTINDLWRFVENDALFSTSAFAAHWYALMVDFWLAAVLGVAFYPYLGNRFWCRFFCPLRAFMELLSKWFGKMAIDSNDKCIGCGECTRYCQMGIDVQRFAQRQETFHNGNSACIHCGICIQVCPMEVLSLADRRFGS
jgi:ferredoxin